MTEFISRGGKDGTVKAGFRGVCYDSSWLTVSTGASLDAMTVLTEGDDYTVQFNRTYTGAVIFLEETVAKDYYIKVRRDVPIRRHFTDFASGGETGLNAAHQLNKEAEYIKLMMEDIAADIAKLPKLDPETATDYDTRFAAVAEGKWIWGATGIGL